LVRDRVDLARGTGLARELVAGDRDLARRAARREDALEHRAQPRGRVLGDHAAALRLRDQLAVDATHDPRRAQDAAVGDRRVGLRHLYRRHREALPDRQVAHRRARVLAELRDDPALLAGQVDAGRRAEAEAPDPRVEALATHLQADLDRADVRRLGE